MMTRTKAPIKLRNWLKKTLAPVARPLLPQRKYMGFVDEQSLQHVAGWLHNKQAVQERVSYEVILRSPKGERILGRGVANSFYTALSQQNIGDACYGFHFIYPQPLSEAERNQVVVRPVGQRTALKLSPNLITEFELISYIAMDIVNNCNLRCPFCLYDYSKTKTTRFMTDETFDRALKLLPSVRDAGFWLSCLHEPSMHPNFLNMIERIPQQWRQKVMFTTNLAKRMPDSYFAFLAECNFYHINISIESTEPAIFEKFRKGARWPIFKDNWDRMIMAWKAAPNPPRIRYIAMVYKSNLPGIPALIEYLRNERCAWQVEVRYTYDMEHIAKEFRDSEYLSETDWDWLEAQVAHYSKDEILFIRPVKPLNSEAGIAADKLSAPDAPHEPGLMEPMPHAHPDDDEDVVSAGHIPCDDEPAPQLHITENEKATVLPSTERAAASADATPATEFLTVPTTKRSVPLPLNIQIEWNGDMIVCGRWSHPDERQMIGVANLNEIDDPYVHLAELAEKPFHTFQGYVDEISATEAKGWIRDIYSPDTAVSFEAAIVSPDETRILAQGVANEAYPGLGFSGSYGFSVKFPESVDATMREHLVIRPIESKVPLDRAPSLQGFVDQRSIHHAAGWVRNKFALETPLAIEAVLKTRDAETVLANSIANQFYAPLAEQFGDFAYCGFKIIFPRVLSEGERDTLIIRVVGDQGQVTLSPRLSINFGPSEILQPEHIAAQ